MKTYFPGTRVVVFDSRIFKDDVTTPLSVTIRPATVRKWYGRRSKVFGNYGNLIDVEFDYRPGVISKGHFADQVEVL